MSDRIGRAPAVLIEAALLAGLYLAFAGSFAAPEALAACMAAASAIACRHGLLEPPRERLALRTIVSRTLAAGRGALVDSAIVAAALVRSAWRRTPLTGGFREMPWHGGGMTLIALSVPPNSYVVEVAPERLVLHDLVEAER